MTRRERERLMRRAAMLQAAQAVFAEKGYTQATLEEIAQRAEFGKGTLYNYFEGGKEEILFAIFDTLYDDLCRLIDEVFAPESATGSFRETFEAFVTQAFAFFVDRQHQFMVLLKEGHRMMFSDDADQSHYFQRQQQRVVDALTAPIERAMQAGALRPLPAQSVAHMILGNIKGYQMHACLKQCTPAVHADQAPSPAEAARFLTTMLLDGLLLPSDVPAPSSSSTIA